MPLITETYYLSLTQDNRGILRLRCSQDDMLRTVNLKLYNNGSIFVIPSGISASVSGVKQNGAVFSKPCTISQDRESVVLQLSSDITNVDGIIVAEVVLNDGNGDRLGTSNFIIQVEKNPIRAGVIQDTETPIEYVNDFITQIQALTARVNNLITPNGDPSLAEVVDARISSLDNNTYQNLKARIDADIATLNTRKANKSEVYTKAQVDTLLDNVEIDVDGEFSDESENPVQNKVVAGAISEIKADLDDVYNGDDGVTLLTKSAVVETYGKYSTNLVYLAANRIIGKVFPDEIPTTVTTDAYAVLIDVEGLTSITYPKVRNTSGNGCLILDSNYTVLRNLPNITDATGTISTVTFDPNDKYFLLSVNRMLEGTDWTLTLTGTPTKGLVTLASDLDAVSVDVDANKNAITYLSDRIASTPNLDAEIVGFICYGQSWSMGYDTQAVTGSQRYDNIMLDTGLMNNPATDMSVNATDFTPLVESTVWSNADHTQRCGETPCTAQTDIVKQLLLAENGLTDPNVKYQIFSAAPGYGDRKIEELSKGTDYYNRLIATVQKAYDIAHAQGKVFTVPAISWAQGRSTNSDSTYYDLLETLRADIDADVKAITGQTIPVKLIAWQAVFGNTTPKRFYDRFVYASEKYENIICSGTFYNYEHVASNNLHLTANSQDWLGCQFGIAYKRTIIDGAKFIPLKPKKAQVYGNIVYVDFYVPVKPLKFDTTLVAEATNKGFQIIDANGTEKTITAVEIVSPDRVKLVCSSDVDSTDHIVYGNVGGTDYSPTTGKRGNLRDNQSIIYKNHNNVDLPCYNWCVVFDKTIAELSV